MSSNFDKITILTLIRENKDVLFGKFSSELSHEQKVEAWKDIAQKAKPIEAFPKDWKYLRDTTWQNWRKRTISGPAIHVAVTAADRRIAPTLIYLLAKGDAFGEEQPMVLHLTDVPAHLDAVRGFAMELMMCGFPLLKDCTVTAQLAEAFKDVDVAFLLPYPKLMPQKSRKERLEERFALYKRHGEALNSYAKKTVKVVIVGHAANTRALICSRYAPSIPGNNFTAVSRYAENFAKSLLSLRLRIKVQDIKDVIEWGNTTDLIYSDLHHATVKMPLQDTDTGAYTAVKNDHWIKGEFNNAIRKLTLDTTDAKRTIAMSVAAVEHMRDCWFGTPPNRLTSMVVRSDGSYDVPKGLFFSFPVVIKNKEWKIVQGLHFDVFDMMKIKENTAELKKEKDEAFDICKRFSPHIDMNSQTVNSISDEELVQFLKNWS